MNQPLTHADALPFLLTRRSHPPKALRAPAPDTATLDRLLTAALRVPDHGKLEPWRLMVLETAALSRLAERLVAHGPASGAPADKIEKAALTFRNSPLVVAVIACEKPSEKVPAVEQLLSSGAVCLSLVNAALAQGFGACWLTGWPAYHRPFLEQDLGLGAQEQIAGFVHIGTATNTPPERPRPDLAALVTRVRA